MPLIGTNVKLKNNGQRECRLCITWRNYEWDQTIDGRLCRIAIRCVARVASALDLDPMELWHRSHEEEQLSTQLLRPYALQQRYHVQEALRLRLMESVQQTRCPLRWILLFSAIHHSALTMTSLKEERCIGQSARWISPEAQEALGFVGTVLDRLISD